MTVKRTILVVLLLTVGSWTFQTNIFAQTGPKLSAVAVNAEIADGDARVGDILSISTDGLKRSASAYDSQMYGVVVEAPILSVEPKTDKTKAVASAGEARVKVTTTAGNIAVGDFITTSATVGAGQKATESGYVLGKALAAYNGQGEDLISTSVEIGYRQVGAGSSGPVGFLQSIVANPGRLRLILATILAALILLGSIVAFVRLVNSGVLAIGRNPLARAQIVRGMFVSGTVVVLIMLIGFGVAVAIVFLGSK